MDYILCLWYKQSCSVGSVKKNWSC